MSAIDELASELARLPGIGRKTALRLTYHLLKQPAAQCRRLADALVGLTERVRQCEICFNLTEAPRCAICSDPRRDGNTICAVEEAADIGAIERAAEFRGVYHVLHGKLSPIQGVGPNDLNLPSLLARIASGEVHELILALSNDIEGEATCHFLTQQIPADRIKVSRIGFGLPSGGGVLYADSVTLKSALDGRRDYR